MASFEYQPDFTLSRKVICRHASEGPAHANFWEATGLWPEQKKRSGQKRTGIITQYTPEQRELGRRAFAPLELFQVTVYSHYIVVV